MAWPDWALAFGIFSVNHRIPGGNRPVSASGFRFGQRCIGWGAEGEAPSGKNIKELRIDLTGGSELGGNWTCIAGVNGAGKSSILQAICLVLLGESLITDVGSDRLRRMWRRTGTEAQAAELLASCRVGDIKHQLYVPFSPDVIDLAKLAKRDDYSGMVQIWRNLQQQLLVSYGASRNLSDYIDTRYIQVNPLVRRQMTLFDPLTQIANVEALLQGGREVAPALETLSTLLRRVLDEEDIGRLVLDRRGDRIRFQRDDTTLEALDLPDGFRSTVAWLAGLCVAWHQAAPGRARGADPAEITGIALIDEIDLHLHAILQRGLVPALRKALPKVQFIVTTHSPLVLSSFARQC